MSEEDPGQERTERASPKRQREARERGQIPRSRELNTTLLLIGASGGFLFLGSSIVGHIQTLMETSLSIDRARIFKAGSMTEALQTGGVDMLIALSPLMLVLLLVALMAPMALGGWAFSTSALGFKWERVDPIQGMKRLFSWQGLLELVKAPVKFALLLAVSAALLWFQGREILELGMESMPQAMGHGIGMVAWSFLALCATLLIIAAVDIPFQLWNYARQLRMTRQELREEMKETDGRPEVKAQIRRNQRRLAQSRMMSYVPKADVILTNPTHVAVALRYDPKHMRAPILVAKGAELVAAQIRRIGAEHDVPIVSAPPLARALYRSTDLNDEIPIGLYLAVAQVLSYVFQLRTYGNATPPSDIAIPPEYKD
jgi:flagellar biosynthesis protein FlhB